MELSGKYEDLGLRYRPELDYRGRNYVPFKGRKNPFCQDCVAYYRMLYDEGYTKDWCDSYNSTFIDGTPNPHPWFIPKCKGSVEDMRARLSVDDFDGDQDAYQHALVQMDPVDWAKVMVDWEARWYQEEMLRCTSQFKAARAGRRIGKTEGMALRILWKNFTTKYHQTLIIAPYQPQVDKIFDLIRMFISKNPSVSSSIHRNRKGPQEIQLNNGSIIRGFSSGARTGAKSDKIRGQDADEIILDEVDYLADEDIEVILAILGSKPHTTVWGSSTPTGIRQKLWGWCIDKTQRYKEFWFPSSESPVWNRDIEYQFQEMYSQAGYMKEFNAEFGMEMVGVFRAQDIEAAIQKYEYRDCVYNSEARYIIGVDWNKTTGTHITVVECAGNKEGAVRYKLVEKVIVRKSEFTQHFGVQKIMDLDRKWKADFIYVDAGYGETQCEMLWKFDVDHPEQNTRYRERLKAIHMNENIIIRDPRTGMEVKKPAKPMMVSLTARQMEEHRVTLPYIEDTTVRIIPEEINDAEIGLIQQMRNFQVTKVSPTGVPRFSDDYEHTLTAFMLSIMGFVLEFSDLRDHTTKWQFARANHPGMGSKTNDAEKNDDFRAKKKREQLQPVSRMEGMEEVPEFIDLKEVNEVLEGKPRKATLPAVVRRHRNLRSYKRTNF